MNTVMKNDKLVTIIEQFCADTDPYLFVDLFLTSEDFQHFVDHFQLLFLEEASDSSNKVYWMNASFLLWDEALMTLELYKNLETLKLQLKDRIGTAILPMFEPLAVYIQRSPFQLEELIESGGDGIKDTLTVNLSIPGEEMDFSEASLQRIDKQISLKQIDAPFVENNLIPLSIYLGETYLKAYDGSWTLKRVAGLDRPIPMIRTIENKETNILRIVYGALTSKHGALLLPSVIYRVLTERPFTPHR